METTPKHFERIYRAMGTWTQCRLCNLWRRTDGQRGDDCHLLPDPLTDWGAFGEILEWVEKWCSERDYHLIMERYVVGDWYVVVDGVRPLGSATASHIDLRTAVLAALESAIGGEQ